MAYSVEVLPWHKKFEVAEGETVLQAALRARVTIPYGCRIGKCSTCKHLVLEGDVDLAGASAHSLLDSEREEGLALLCVAKPRSDIVIELVGVEAEEDAGIEPVHADATVSRVDCLTPKLRAVTIGLQRPLPFRPGQYAELRIPGGPWRQYSIASSCSTPDSLQFVIKVLEGGAFSSRVDLLRPGDPVELVGPYGTAYFRPEHGRALLVAAGSGIGPMMGILRSAVDCSFGEKIVFYYGARTQADLPFGEEIRDAARHLDVEYVPTLSAADARNLWQGEMGRVTHTVGRRFDPEGFGHAYVCGPPEMCDAVTYLLEGKGMPRNRIYQDAFYPAE